MKRVILIYIISILSIHIYGQDKTLFIFEQFIPAKIHFKNKSVTSALMNYDAVNDKMYFMQKDMLMELTNAAMIDSIVWAKKRTFIPQAGHYIEKVQLKNGSAFIHWKIKNVNIGSAGAMGTVTQAKVESISIRAMGVFSAEHSKSNNADVYQLKNANEYFIPINGELKRIINVKQIVKLLPKHKENIQSFIKEQNIKFSEPLMALELINYCLGLSEFN